MKLIKLQLKNFRSIKEANIDFNNINIVMGKNDAGKSSILTALDIFFNEKEAVIDNDDFNKKTDGDIEIICSFEINLSKEVDIDAGNKTTFKSEYLLQLVDEENETGILCIKKRFDKGTSKPKGTNYLICNYPNYDEKDRLISMKINDLKKYCINNNINIDDISKRTKSEIRTAIYNHDSKALKEIDLPTAKLNEDKNDLFEKIKSDSDFPKFLLLIADRQNTDKDGEFTDTFKKIVKGSITEELNNKFTEQIANNVKKELQATGSGTIMTLKETFGESIADTLEVKTDIDDLSKLFKFQLSSDDSVPFNKRGSGVKRLIALSFLIYKSKQEKKDANIIYAIEEPETSQNPTYQKIIFESLKNLSKTSQILLTSHTPEIIKHFDVNNVIYLKKGEVQNDIENMIEDLGLLSYFNSTVLLVEGSTDKDILKILNKNIPELKKIVDLDDIIIQDMKGFTATKPGNSPPNGVSLYNHFTSANCNVLMLLDSDAKPEEQRNKVTKYGIAMSNVVLTKRREIENYMPKALIQSYLPDDFDYNTGNIPQAMLQKGVYKGKDGHQFNKNKEKENQKVLKNCLVANEWLSVSSTNLDTEAFNEIKTWFEKVKSFTEKKVQKI